MSDRSLSLRSLHVAASALLAASIGLTAPTAKANGRFPRAQRFIESADDPNVLSLYGTYGLLVTKDAGRTWNHICEAATGIYTGEDALLEILPGQHIVIRTDTSLVTSADSWCDWTTVLGNSAETIQDITRDPSAAATVLALLGAFDPAVGFSSRLVESANGGTTWSEPTVLPRESLSHGLTLDVAPSKPSRVYVSGLDLNGKGKLLVSDDRGKTWSARSLESTDSNAAPYLAVVAKDYPDRVFVRTDAYQEIDGIDTASDALLLSVDAGKSWSRLFERHAKLFGFALSPDGSTVLAGYGDPKVAATFVDPDALGLYRASVAELISDPEHAADHFTKIFDGSITCLRWTATALYACTSTPERGFEVGRAANAAFSRTEPSPFEPLLVLTATRPLSCGPETAGHACFAEGTNGYSATCRVFGASCDAGSPLPAGGGAGGGGAGGSSSGGAAPAGSGTTAGGASGSAAGGGGRSADGGGRKSSGCALSHGGSRAEAPGRTPGALLAAFAIAISRRRRRDGIALRKMRR